METELPQKLDASLARIEAQVPVINKTVLLLGFLSTMLGCCLATSQLMNYRQHQGVGLQLERLQTELNLLQAEVRDTRYGSLPPKYPLESEVTSKPRQMLDASEIIAERTIPQTYDMPAAPYGVMRGPLPVDSLSHLRVLSPSLSPGAFAKPQGFSPVFGSARSRQSVVVNRFSRGAVVVPRR